MKNLLCILLCIFSTSLFAQNISGLYSGKLVNDSTRKEQQYELALSEYRGNITGYSYTTFVVNDSFYYSVKRVKAERNGDVLLVEDVKMLANNFPRQPEKGVRQIMQIPLNGQDSVTELKGNWKTSKTKVFYSIGGAMNMRRESDSSRMVLLQHLYDIGEWHKPTYQKEQPAAIVARKEKTIKEKTNPRQEATTPKNVQGLAYHQRNERIQQSIHTAADSLVLSFYDNGVVDGDTISVYLNGVNIISKVKLTAAAAKQVIRLDNSAAVHKLVLVAENLGTIPPNTGLLVIEDGMQRYQVHFTADLQTNAAIEFKQNRKSQ